MDELNHGRQEATYVLCLRRMASPFVLAEEILQCCRDPVGLTAVVWGGVAGTA